MSYPHAQARRSSPFTRPDGSMSSFCAVFGAADMRSFTRSGEFRGTAIAPTTRSGRLLQLTAAASLASEIVAIGLL
jgi:hypothetical protein